MRCNRRTSTNFFFLSHNFAFPFSQFHNFFLTRNLCYFSIFFFPFFIQSRTFVMDPPESVSKKGPSACVLGSNIRRLSSLQKLWKALTADWRMESGHLRTLAPEHSLFRVGKAAPRAALYLSPQWGSGAGFSWGSRKRVAKAEDPHGRSECLCRQLTAAILDWGVMRRAWTARQLRSHVARFSACHFAKGILVSSARYGASACGTMGKKKSDVILFPRFYFYSRGINGLCW